MGREGHPATTARESHPAFLGWKGGPEAAREVPAVEKIDRAGQVINCVTFDGSTRCSKNAGGWPVYAQNRRALTLPANHATMTGSGYTNLELWLQQLDKSMAGVIAARSPGTPHGRGTAAPAPARCTRAPS